MRVRLEYLAGIRIYESQVERIGVRRAGCVAEFSVFQNLAIVLNHRQNLMAVRAAVLPPTMRT